MEVSLQTWTPGRCREGTRPGGYDVCLVHSEGFRGDHGTVKKRFASFQGVPDSLFPGRRTDEEDSERDTMAF